MAGVVLLLIVVAGVAWQFTSGGRAPTPAGAAQASPAPVTPVVATTPDVGPSIANVASVPQWGNGASTPKPSR
jgi:hypothetical protein